MINDFGEEITDDEIEEIIDRVVKLPDESIDELFYSLGIVFVDHKKYKALLDDDIEDIRKNRSKSVISSLLSEAPIGDIMDKLKELESR